MHTLHAGNSWFDRHNHVKMRHICVHALAMMARRNGLNVSLSLTKMPGLMDVEMSTILCSKPAYEVSSWHSPCIFTAIAIAVVSVHY
jgi:hypothetical protein